MIKPDHFAVMAGGRHVHELGEPRCFLGVSVVTPRYWNKTGRLVPRWRIPGGHRQYGVDDLNDTADVEQSSRRVV